MKIKSIYIYLGIFLLALMVIVYFTVQSKSTEMSIANNEMPKDNVHSQFNNSQPPSGSNVSNEFKSKLKSLEEYVDKNPNDTAKVREYADLLYGSHNPKKSIELYESILEKDSKRIDILMSLAIVEFEQNNFNEAESYIRKILDINPKNVEAIYNLGVMQARNGDFLKAKENWTKIINEFPNHKLIGTVKTALSRLETKKN
ncbi:MAG: tetratricopeptide repeat protein [Ignavibacteriae bacterium]|nr:tetratricopeptide repeat protein [Ignavibacteriota bacterium]